MNVRSNIILLTLLLSFLSLTTVFGQKSKTKTKTKSFAVTNKEKDNRSKNTRTKSGTIKRRGSDTYWIIGVGGNVVDDDGNPFKKLFSAPLRWNVRPYPTRLTVERSLKNSFSLESAFNFNTYKPIKIINNEVGRAGIFLSLDVNLKNSIGRDGFFNPYIVYGAGGTFRTVRIIPIGGNLNIGFGFNLWFSHSFGINFQSIAKFAVSTRFPRSSGNYLQHSTGLVFKIQNGGKNPFIKRRYKWIHRNNIGRERT